MYVIDLCLYSIPYTNIFFVCCLFLQFFVCLDVSRFYTASSSPRSRCVGRRSRYLSVQPQGLYKQTCFEPILQ